MNNSRRVFSMEHETIPNDEVEYQVANITSVRYSRRGTEYYVHWVAGDKTWEPECNLQGCEIILRNFCSSHNIPMPNIDFHRPNYGASKSYSVDYRNFCSLDEVLDNITVYGSAIRLKVDSVVDIFVNEFPSCDSIIIIPHDKHLYVCGVSFAARILYVSDGNNQFESEPEIERILISKYPDFKVHSVAFSRSTGSDHCASAAVLIAISFRRSFATSIWTDIIIPPVWLQETLIKKLHKFTSESVNLPANIVFNKERSKLSCVCGKTFKKQQAFVTHKRFCKN